MRTSLQGAWSNPLQAAAYARPDRLGSRPALLTITPALLTYATDAVTRTYGAANSTFTGTVTGFVLGDTLAGVTTGSAVFTSAAGCSSPVGRYAIDGSGLTLTSSNYTLVQAFANATALTITPKSLNVALTGTASEYDTAGVGTGKLVTVDALQLGGADAANYTLSSSVVAGNVGVITQRPLTVRADDVTKLPGEPLPNFTVTYTGFAPGEDPSVLGGRLQIDTAASAGSAGEPQANTVLAALWRLLSALCQNGDYDVIDLGRS